MDKTPIQELIDYFEGMSNDAPSFETRDRYKMIVSHIRNRYLEKEKQFGFDCFSAGVNWEFYESNPHVEPFDEFYSQYIQQQKQ